MMGISAEQLNPIAKTNLAVHASATEVISINDNGGQGGFDFYPVPLQRAQGAGAYAVNVHFSHEPLSGASYRIALLSRRHTDVMLVDIRQWPHGLYADPRTVSGRAAWYSFAFLLRTAAAALLDVDVQELQAGIRTLDAPGAPRGQAFLSDTLENGAGYCRWLAVEENFRNLLTVACDLTNGQVAAKWVQRDHAERCDTSCNHCLRDFHNMQYHGLLDWRLGLDMARLSGDAAATLDLDAMPSPSVRNLWRPFVDGAQASVSRALAQLGYQPVAVAGIPCFISARRQRALVSCHPLWTAENPLFQQALAELQRKHAGFSVSPLNLLVAVRRPADYI